MRSASRSFFLGLLCLGGLSTARADVASIRTPPAGSNGSVQYNSRGQFGGGTDLTYSTTTLTLTTPILVVSTVTFGGITYKPPPTQTGGYYLTTDGAGQMSWAALTSVAVSTGRALGILDGTSMVVPSASSITFNASQFVISLQGTTTAAIALDVSSVTLMGSLSASQPIVLTGSTFSINPASATLLGPDPALGGALSGTLSNAVLGIVDISAKTNLAVAAPVTLSGDTIGVDKSSVTLLGPTIDASELPADGYASTYVNVTGDTMTGQLTVISSVTVTSSMTVTNSVSATTLRISSNTVLPGATFYGSGPVAVSSVTLLGALGANGGFGLSGQFLKSQGTSSPAVWATVSGVASNLAVSTSGVIVSSPTPQIDFNSSQFTASLSGTTTQIVLSASSVTLRGPNVINLQSTAQGAGSVFNVSSGTVTSLNATTMTITQDLIVGDDATIAGGLTVSGGSGITISSLSGNECVETNASGRLTTTGSACGAGGGGTPGGTGSQIQYNNSGSFGGVPGSTVTITGPQISSATINTIKTKFVNSISTLTLGGGSDSDGNQYPWAALLPAGSANMPATVGSNTHSFALGSVSYDVSSAGGIPMAFFSDIGNVGVMGLWRGLSLDHQGFKACAANGSGTDDFWQLPCAESAGFIKSDGSHNLSLATLSASDMSAIYDATGTWNAQQLFRSGSPSTFTYLTVGDGTAIGPLKVRAVAASNTAATIKMEGATSTNGDGNIDYYSEPATFYERLRFTNINLNSGTTERRYKQGWNFEDSNGKVLAYVSRAGGVVLNSTGSVTLFDGPTSKSVVITASATIATSYTMKLPNGPATSTNSFVSVQAINGNSFDTTYFDLFNATPTYGGQASWTSANPSTFTALAVTGLTASQLVRTDANKKLVSSATLTTTELAGVLAAAQFPALTGDVTTSAGSLATTLASIVTANQFGSATVVPVITFDAKGRITAVSSATISGGGGSGYSVEPATVTFRLDRGMTASTGTFISSVTVVGSGGLGVTYGITGGSGTFSDLTASQMIRTDSNKKLISSATLTTTELAGILGAAQFPALTGDITSTAGALATTASANQANIKTLGASSTTVSGASGLLVTGASGSSTTYSIYGGSISIRPLSDGTSIFQLLNLAGSMIARMDTSANATNDVVFTVIAPVAASFGLGVSTNTGGPYFLSVSTSGHIGSGGTAPAITSCGTSPTFNTNCNDNSCTITPGATAAGCTITFNKAGTNAPTCVISEQTMSLVNALSYTVSATAITVTQTALSSKIDYICNFKD